MLVVTTRLVLIACLGQTPTSGAPSAATSEGASPGARVPESADASKLVEELGAPRFQDRTAAREALRKLGGAALVALRTALKSRDPEVRASAARLIDEVERDELVNPSRVALDFEDRPLGEIMTELGRRLGMSMHPVQPDDPRWTTTRATLTSPTRTSYWQMVDRLAAEQGVQVGGLNFGMPAGGSQVPIWIGPPFPPAKFKVDTGPVRVRVDSFQVQKELHLNGAAPPFRPGPPPIMIQPRVGAGGARPGVRVEPRPAAPPPAPAPDHAGKPAVKPAPNPADAKPAANGAPVVKAQRAPPRFPAQGMIGRPFGGGFAPGGVMGGFPAGNTRPSSDGQGVIRERFTMQLHVMCEPRMSMTQTGPVKILKAIDDLGHSILDPDLAAGMSAIYPMNTWANAMPFLSYTVNFTSPSAGSRSLRVLSGKVPLALWSRLPKPLEFGLAGSEGKTFRNERTGLKVEAVKELNQASRRVYQCVLVPGTVVAGEADASASGNVASGANMINQRVEVFDASGKPLSAFVSPNDATGEHFSVNVMTPEISAVKLRLYELRTATFEAGFEFRDVPIP